MKKYVLVFITSFITVSGFTQKTADLGIWGGATSYWGDLKEVNYSTSLKPLYGAFFRYNLNPRYSLRGMYLTGNVGASGVIENVPWSFDKKVHSISAMFEINYLKYLLGNRKTPFSPYIMGGIGIMYFNYYLSPAAIYTFNQRHNKGTFEIDNTILAVTAPFGMGIKTHIGKRFGIGAEFIIQKIFSDKLDNLDDPLAHINQLGEETIYNDLLHNNDYTIFAGITLTYKINLTKEICPAYESKN